MKNLQLSGTPRTEFGKKKAKQIRKSGEIPCVLYGGKEVVHFNLKESSVRPLLYTPSIYTVQLTIGDKTYMSILKDAQFHPVDDKPLHLDFLEIFEDKPIEMEVPIKLTGLSEGVKAGGKLSQSMRKLKVKALYQHIPEVLDIDITHLDLGKSLSVGSLAFDKLEIVTPKQSIVCSVKMTRVSRAQTPAK
jgi:large subunit ribosomal protein L25